MYTPISTGLDHERNISGGVGSPAGEVQITEPAEMIAGVDTVIRFDASGVLADYYKLTIGTFPGGDDVRDYPETQNTAGFSFNNPPAQTLYVTLRYRFGPSGEYRSVSRTYFQAQQTGLPPESGEWDDGKPWNDNLPWVD